MNQKQLTDGSITRLFHILTDTPLPGAELTEEQRESVEKKRLRGQILRDFAEYKEQKRFEQLVQALEIPLSPSMRDADLRKLYRVVTG